MPLKPRYHKSPASKLPTLRREVKVGEFIGRTKFTCTKRWMKFRRWYLNKHPLCFDCPVPSAATEVHHIIKRRDDPNGDGWFDEENCMALCAPCHNRRTGRGE